MLDLSLTGAPPSASNHVDHSFFFLPPRSLPSVLSLLAIPQVLQAHIPQPFALSLPETLFSQTATVLAPWLPQGRCSNVSLMGGFPDCPRLHMLALQPHHILTPSSLALWYIFLTYHHLRNKYIACFPSLYPHERTD